ncbi:MAG: hypothetical protein ACPLEW_03805 [Pseudothermotoga sp.]
MFVQKGFSKNFCSPDAYNEEKKTLFGPRYGVYFHFFNLVSILTALEQPSEFSGGKQQNVATARVIVYRPKLI